MGALKRTRTGPPLHETVVGIGNELPVDAVNVVPTTPFQMKLGRLVQGSPRRSCTGPLQRTLVGTKMFAGIASYTASSSIATTSSSSMGALPNTRCLSVASVMP